MALEKTKPTEKNQYTKHNNSPLKKISYRVSLLHEGQTKTRRKDNKHDSEARVSTGI